MTTGVLGFARGGGKSPRSHCRIVAGKQRHGRIASCAVPRRLVSAGIGYSRGRSIWVVGPFGICRIWTMDGTGGEMVLRKPNRPATGGREAEIAHALGAGPPSFFDVSRPILAEHLVTPSTLQWHGKIPIWRIDDLGLWNRGACRLVDRLNRRTCSARGGSMLRGRRQHGMAGHGRDTARVLFRYVERHF